MARNLCRHYQSKSSTSRLFDRSRPPKLCRSDNGLQPSIHEGSKVTQLRRQGIHTEISLKNNLIKQQNAENQRLPEILKGLEQEILLSETTIKNLRDQDLIQKTEEQKNKRKMNKI